MFVIVSQLIKTSPFTSLWDGSVSVNFFKDNAKINGKYSAFLLFRKKELSF
jgi:hypothetical protein